VQRLMLLLVIAGLLLAACAPAATPQTAQPKAPEQAAVATAKPAATQPTSQEAPTEIDATEAPAAVPTDVPTAATTKRPVKTELEATDPTTVQLAAGKPQLVEFFAFW
jgi:hypothetical protein